MKVAGEEGEGDGEWGDRVRPDALSSSNAARLWSASLRDCLRRRVVSFVAFVSCSDIDAKYR